MRTMNQSCAYYYNKSYMVLGLPTDTLTTKKYNSKNTLAVPSHLYIVVCVHFPLKLKKKPMIKCDLKPNKTIEIQHAAFFL